MRNFLDVVFRDIFVEFLGVLGFLGEIFSGIESLFRRNYT